MARGALGVLCALALYAAVHLLSGPVLGWIDRVGDAHQARAGGYTIVGE